MADVPHVLVHDGLPIMACGLPAMAAQLTANGFPTQVWNLFAEDAARSVRAPDLATLRLLGISVHWFYQLPGAIDLASRARAEGYEGYVVLGGFTASTFAEEIVERHPAVDGVIRGDGEEPLLELVRALDRRTPRFDSIPNLVWRDEDGRARNNGISYVGGSTEIDALDFGRLNFVRQVTSHFAASSWRAITDGSPMVRADLDRTFYLCGGRGCSVDCVTCGGGRKAHRAHSGRRAFSFRSPTRIADDVEQAIDAGATSVHACFDPVPNGPHWREFMTELATRAVRTTMVFESFGLPDDSFLQQFGETFDHGVVVISPETADEQVRARVRGFSYSNDELFHCLERAGDLGLVVQLFLGYFVPFEGLRQLHRTRAWARDLQRHFAGHVEVLHLPFSTDPVSPLFIDPAAHGMRCGVGAAADYERELRRSDPWLDNLLRHTPAAGTPEDWRAVTLGLELEMACRSRLPDLVASIEDRVGDRIDAFFLRLARRLLATVPERTLRRSQLAEIVLRHAGDVS